MQKINTEIFKDADGMMDNIKKVTEHLASIGKTTYKVLAYEKPWHVLSFIEGAHSVDVIEDPAQAYTAGAASELFKTILQILRLATWSKQFRSSTTLCGA